VFYWIGAYDTDENPNVFQWVTGEKFSYSNWPTGQPDNGDWGVGGHENYIGILHFDKYGPVYSWNDFRNGPNDQQGYICEWEE
jgi:hypothetical protein